jgi:hypothetical protein
VKGPVGPSVGPKNLSKNTLLRDRKTSDHGPPCTRSGLESESLGSAALTRLQDVEPRSASGVPICYSGTQSKDSPLIFLSLVGSVRRGEHGQGESVEDVLDRQDQVLAAVELVSHWGGVQASAGVKMP